MAVLITYVGGPANLRQEVKSQVPPMRRMDVPVLSDPYVAEREDEEPRLLPNIRVVRYYLTLLPARVNGLVAYVAWCDG